MRQVSVPPQTAPEAPRLLNQVQGKIRLKHYSSHIEQSYTDWVKRFILFHGKRHPETMGRHEIGFS